jgi:hypothetical protein
MSALWWEAMSATSISDKVNHKRFLKHLSESGEAVEKAAAWFKGKGYEVEVPETRFAGTHLDWKDYADEGDLFVRKEVDAVWDRIEVKRRGVEFSCREDYPFPSFFVCARHSFDRARLKPFAFLIFDSDLSHMGIVFGSGWQRWRVVKRFDRRYEGVWQAIYEADLGDVRFRSV